MLAVSLGQIAANARRLIAVFLAVMLSVSFLAATLIVGTSTTASLAASIGSSYAAAELILFPSMTGTIPQDTVDKVSRHGSVARFHARQELPVPVDLGSATIAATVGNQPVNPAFAAVQLQTGQWPAAAAEVAVDEATALKYGLALGSTVDFSGTQVQPDGTDRSVATGAIVGITANSTDPLTPAFGNFLLHQSTFDDLSYPNIGYRSVLLQFLPGTGIDAAREALAMDLGVSPESLMTPKEYVDNEVDRWSGSQGILAIILTAFAIVALLVAVLVVSNTFSVLMTQRTRELALLRCIGAKRRQIFCAVVLEAAIVGFAASLGGVLVAVATMAAAVAFISGQPETSYATLNVSPSSMVLALLLGSAVTVLASLAPAYKAFQVSPLASLRPLEALEVKTTTKKGRLILGAGLMVVGGTALLWGVTHVNLLVSMGGGIVTFIAVLACLGTVVTTLIRSMGKMLGWAQAPGEMAVANAVRNPRRTASTAAALLIGVTLVTTMVTGAASAKTTLEQTTAALFPVDMTVETLPTSTGATGPSQENMETAASLKGITALVHLQLVGLAQTGTATIPAYGLSAQDSLKAITDQNARPVPGKVLMPKNIPANEVQLLRGDTQQQAPATASGANGSAALVLLESFTALPATDQLVKSTSGLIFIAVDPVLDRTELQNLRMDLAQTLGIPENQISGAAIEKAAIGQAIDTALLIVLGLLGITVVIAFVGVTNAITLSVLERTRENSLLRALGLSRHQLRWMLVLETLLITGITVIIGIALGSTYGASAVLSGLGAAASATVTIPYQQILALTGLTLTAATLAALIPAHQATKKSPIAGIKTD